MEERSRKIRKRGVERGVGKGRSEGWKKRKGNGESIKRMVMVNLENKMVLKREERESEGEEQQDKGRWDRTREKYREEQYDRFGDGLGRKMRWRMEGNRGREWECKSIKRKMQGDGLNRGA